MCGLVVYKHTHTVEGGTKLPAEAKGDSNMGRSGVMLMFPGSSITRSPSISLSIHPCKSNLSSSMPLIPGKKLKQQHVRVDIVKKLKNGCMKLVDGFVDSVFEFSDQTLHPNQTNLAPVEEIGAPVAVADIQGTLPQQFPQGIFLRNGPNPLFGGLKSSRSILGRSSFIWVEGEGMLHAIYFKKNINGEWHLYYNNRYVQTDSFQFEKHVKNRPSFLPAVEGDALAVVAAFVLNWLRFGEVNKDMSNTNVIEHSGRFYSVAENSMPQEIDIMSLQSLGVWDVCRAWNRPFTSHPKVRFQILLFMSIGPDGDEDGKRMVHKVDVKLSRSSLTHEIGVTRRFNVILDYPVTIDLNRLIRGGSLIKFEKEGYAKIGVMPRYGDADSIQWFEVKPNCTMHLFNCFEHEHEVLVWGCRATDSFIPGPEKGLNKFEWFSQRFKPVRVTDEQNTEDGSLLSRAYQWRVNLKTGEVRERFLTGNQFSMDFPFINSAFTGLKNKYGYAQVLDSVASSNSGMFKFGGLAKLHFEEPQSGEVSLLKDSEEEPIKVEYHMLENNSFCTGASFVPREDSLQEDDGWVIAHVHNEITNTSQVNSTS
ncbi:Carotenoid 9,10(9',10')-cleavage dioxygenase, partial [Cucurbita argyrosperma subsp. sororia]